MINKFRNAYLIRFLRRIKYIYHKYFSIKSKAEIIKVQNINNLRNFFQIFGIIKIKNCYTKKELKNIVKEYDGLVYKNTGITIKKNDTTPKAIRNNLEMQNSVSKIIMTSGTLKILEQLIGNDMVLTGVELVTFRNGTKLHRDTFQPFSSTKIGFYLQESNWLNNGDFIYIPGSHNWYSNYANDELSNLLGWPDNDWGLDNKKISNNLFVSTIKDHLELSLEEPISKVPINFGDILIFDNRLIHGSFQKTFRTRRMIAFSFLEGYQSFKFKNPNISSNKFISERALFIAAESIATRKSQNQNYVSIQECIKSNLKFNFLEKYLLSDYENNLVNDYTKELKNNPERVKKIITGIFTNLN